MNNYDIFDVSCFIHAGSSSSWGKAKVANVPVGGMRFFLRKLTSSLLRSENVACAFDYNSKTSLHKGSGRLEGYKANRKRKADVIIQEELLYKYLMKSGINCYVSPRYEADDFVYSLVEEIYPRLNTIVNCNIYSDDKDLLHNIDENKVYQNAVTSNALNVCGASLPVSIDFYGEKPILNTISAGKVFCGDKSDNIKNFMSSNGVKGVELYHAYNELLRTRYCSLNARVKRSKELLMSFINQVVTDENDRNTLRKRADAIYPRDVRGKEMTPLKFSSPDSVDFVMLASLARSIGDTASLRNIRVKPDPSIVSQISDELYSKGKEYTSGVYHADRNINMKNSTTFAETINVGGF